MKVWLIYCLEDIYKNKKSIEMFKKNFKKYDADCELVIFEEIHEKLIKETEYPDIVINRSRSCEIAERLKNEVRHVYNTPRIAELGNDKMAALDFAKKNGLKIMEYYNGISEIKTYPVVAKTKAGHGGNEVFLVKSKAEAEKIYSAYREVFFQEYSEQGCEDIRVYIVGGRILCAIKRQSGSDFRSNYSLGGHVAQTDIPEDIYGQLTKLLKSLGEIAYCGIDFIKYQDTWVFNEIEDVVGARSVYTVTGHDPIGEFVKWCISKT